MKNKLLGSSLIVAGTTIGAGMLAMPITSASMGFLATVPLLLALWALLTYSALLFVEVYQTSDKSVGLSGLAELYYGKAGRVVITIVLLVFMYAISAAYITGGGSLINGLISTSEGAQGKALHSSVGILLFTGVLGMFVIVGMSSVDAANRFIFACKVIVFAFVIFMMLPKVAVDNLLSMPINNALVLSAAPVFFTSFGFHVIIPSIIAYLDGDIGKSRKAMVIGTLIPLVAYLLWQLSTHGVLTQSQFLDILQKDPTLNGLVNASREISSSNVLGEAVRIFSALALITSFLGVSLSLFDSLKDLLHRLNFGYNRWIIGLLTFAPSLLFALFYPEGFIAALAYAGIMFAFYGLILPVGLAWKARARYPDMPYKVIGGKAGLVIAFICGVLIIAIPFAVQMGILPAVIG